MERHLVGLCILLLTFAAGTCVVDPRLLFQKEEEFKCFAGLKSKLQNNFPLLSDAVLSEFPHVRRAEET